MPKKNTFCGGTLAKETIKLHYLDTPDFHHFTFQQMIDDGTKANDDYTLIAYAVDANGKALSGALKLASLTSPSITAKKNVQFANMKLSIDDLKTLYPSSDKITDLNIYPTAFYKDGGYIVYTAQPTIGSSTLVPPKIILNPSPPA